MVKRTELLIKLDNLRTRHFELEMKDCLNQSEALEKGSVWIEIRESERELEKLEQSGD